MYPRDRIANLGLILGAVAAWAAVAWLFTTRSPIGNSGVQLAGALLLGAALALTLCPIFWLIAFARRRRIAHRGDWLRAARRAVLCGLVVVLLLVLRAFDTLSLPIAAFVVAMAGLIELSLTLRR
ncbi:MAG: hypothetical protein QOH61_673 [Chloroflexota bacterium]|nr:hypothetical protein [Chloroflexota bacterium]